MLVATHFDDLLTFQMLFNDKKHFLELENNSFLIYSYQNNLWWLFAIWSGVFSVAVILFSMKTKNKDGRFLLLLIPILQLIGTFMFVVF